MGSRKNNNLEKRFEFGRNWKNFLSSLSDESIKSAEQSLQSMLGLKELTGKTFLDIGSGSGLFSLAARNLGAKVHSFDFDESSVSCTSQLKSTFYKEDNNWTICHGSVLDTTFMYKLGLFDIVYSWGVLHHTGDMWSAMENASDRVDKNGSFFIAIYNDQGLKSKYWKFIKYLYVNMPWTRPIWIIFHTIYPAGPSFLLKKIIGARIPRGMNFWHDLKDWLGGYPYQVASREVIINFLTIKGFKLERLVSCGNKLGCNEFFFKKKD